MSVHDFKTPKQPFLNVEYQAPFWLAAILVACYGIFVVVPDALKNSIWFNFALIAEQGHVLLADRPLRGVYTLLTHVLTHGGWSHVLVNAGLIVAFGVITMRGMRNPQKATTLFLGIFCLGAIGGGLGQWLVWVLTGSTGIAVGASTGGMALFATTAWALGGRSRVFAFFAVMVAFDAIGIYMGKQNFASLTANPAWAGHMGGFLVGAILARFWVRPSSTGIQIIG